ncbi:hypothetical protein L1077_14960 [Pseudoalteromonas luteoviolacea]|uniref:hypothetical protein n=1 Tax=Pseudoalteromonas luteoviolacea TaxID=43657 RepID=UPI001F2804CF|nr:hypothetical protein [Pseudoalteromonas luteoviolacea]MCF6440734.1 hypothetical protein [Pseudoalteromonas luteoviolacea]
MKINQFSLTPILASFIILGGCGGSSGDSKENEITTPTVNSQPTLTVNVKKRTKCGVVDYSDAAILLHDENGQVISTHSSDSAGYFSQQIPEGAKHASIIGIESFDGLEKTQKIYTKLDISDGADFADIEFQDQSAYCTCKDVNVDLSALKVTHSDYRIIREGDTGGVTINEYQDSVRVCGNDEKLYYSINQPGYELYTLAKVDVPEEVNSISVNGGDFVHQSEDIEISQLEQQSRVHVNGIDESGKTVFRNFDFFNGAAKLKMYPTGFDHHELYYYKSMLFGYEGLSLIISNGLALKFEQTDQVSDLILPNAPTELAQQLSAGISSVHQGDIISYDFSGLDTRIQTAEWEFSFDTNKLPIKWHVSGALVSEFPIFSFGDEVALSKESEPVHSRVLLSGYDGAPAQLSEYRRYVYQHHDKQALNHNVYIYLSTTTDY